MFLNRNDKLNQMIELYNKLDNSNNCQALNETNEVHCQAVRSFLFNNIEDFARTILEGIFEIERFDYEFANTLYEFDKILFEKNMKEAINVYLPKFDFYQILRTLSRFKYYLQAIIGYEAVFEQFHDICNDTKESYELSRKLQEIIAVPLFSQITEDRRCRLIDMAKSLPLYPEDLCGSDKFLITNLGNKFHLNSEMVREKNLSFVFPTLTFDTQKVNWTLRRDEESDLYEIESPSGHVLCWVKPFLPSFINRVIPAEVMLMEANEAKNTKWEILYIEEGNPSKGFAIKAAEHNIFISGARSGDFSTFVSVLKEIDVEESERCAWKFQKMEYSIALEN